MTTEGFNLEGLLRSMQGDVMGLIGFIIFILLVLWFARFLIGKTKGEIGMTDEQAVSAKRTVRTVAGAIIILGLGGFAWHAVSVTAANRIPRSDVNKAGVYDQMNNVAQTPR